MNNSSKNVDRRIGAKVKKNAPQISVIIPVYNAAEFVAETLDSALTQNFRDFEIILVNDGSPDSGKLEKILEPYFDEIIYIKQENNGTAAARNTAIGASRGDFLAFLDGDDVWFPEYLEAQIGALSTEKCDLIYADALFFGNVPHDYRTFMSKFPSVGAVTAESLIGAKCTVLTSGTVVRREKVLDAGSFDENLPRIGMEDFDLWFRLAKNGARLDYQQRVLLKYRIHPNSLSGNFVERAERSVRGLEHIRAKYKLSETEKAAWEKRMLVCKAQLEMEKGKFCLAQGDFCDAQMHIAEANKFYRKPKLFLLNNLIKISPQFTLSLSKKMRPAEFTFITAEKS